MDISSKLIRIRKSPNIYMYEIKGGGIDTNAEVQKFLSDDLADNNDVSDSSALKRGLHHK